MINNSTPLHLNLSSVLEWKHYILLLFMFLSKKLRPCYWLQKNLQNIGSGFEIQSITMNFYLFQGRQEGREVCLVIPDLCLYLRFARILNVNQLLTVFGICSVVWHLLVDTGSSKVISWCLNTQLYCSKLCALPAMSLNVCLYCHLPVPAHLRKPVETMKTAIKEMQRSSKTAQKGIVFLLPARQKGSESIHVVAQT